MREYIEIRPTDHQGWLDERAKGIGSSDAGTIMGSSPFSTPYKLWRLKMGYDKPIEENDAMRNGHILEPAVAEWFSMTTGAIIDRDSEGDWIAADKNEPFLRVSPDRLFWPKDTPFDEMTRENCLLLEIKSTSKLVEEDNIPDYWYCQVQYQMHVLRIKKAALAWLTSEPRLGFGYTWIDYNPAFASLLIGEIRDFWNNHVITGIPPEEQNGEDTSLKWPKATQEETIADEQTINDCNELRELKATIKANKEREEELISRIKMSMGPAECLFINDEEGNKQILATWKNNKGTVRLDEGRLKTEKPTIYKKYSVTTKETKLDMESLKAMNPKVFEEYSTTTPGARVFSIKGLKRK